VCVRACVYSCNIPYANVPYNTGSHLQVFVNLSPEEEFRHGPSATSVGACLRLELDTTGDVVRLRSQVEHLQAFPVTLA